MVVVCRCTTTHHHHTALASTHGGVFECTKPTPRCWWMPLSTFCATKTTAATSTFTALRVRCAQPTRRLAQMLVRGRRHQRLWPVGGRQHATWHVRAHGDDLRQRLPPRGSWGLWAARLGWSQQIHGACGVEQNNKKQQRPSCSNARADDPQSHCRAHGHAAARGSPSPLLRRPQRGVVAAPHPTHAGAGRTGAGRWQRLRHRAACRGVWPQVGLGSSCIVLCSTHHATGVA